MADALAHNGDEGRGVAAISFGEVCSTLRSEDLRMGKPYVANLHNRDSLLFITIRGLMLMRLIYADSRNVISMNPKSSVYICV